MAHDSHLLIHYIQQRTNTSRICNCNVFDITTTNRIRHRQGEELELLSNQLLTLKPTLLYHRPTLYSILLFVYSLFSGGIRYFTTLRHLFWVGSLWVTKASTVASLRMCRLQSISDAINA